MLTSYRAHPSAAAVSCASAGGRAAAQRVALRARTGGPAVLITTSRGDSTPVVVIVEGKVGLWAVRCLRPLADLPRLPPGAMRGGGAAAP